MGDLKTQLASKPKESGGSRASNRIDFQKDWALCRLLELHETPEDYALMVERHDDVVVLDSPTTPRRADFTQVKTKDSGNWTVAQLLKIEKSKAAPDKKVEKKMSYLAKMYGNRLVCEGNEITANFVSNARFGVTLANGEDGSNRAEICFSELCQEELSKVRKQIKDEHSLSDEPDCGDFMYFRVTDLALGDSPGHAKGKIAEFLERRGSGETQPVAAFYRTLFDQLKRRTNYEPEIRGWDELLRRKSITRGEFQDILDKLPKPRNFDAARTEISGQLRHEGMLASSIIGIFDDWKRHEVERMDRKNTILLSLIHAAEEAVDAIKADGVERSLIGMLQEGASKIEERRIKGAELYRPPYRMAVLLMRLYGY